LQRASVEVERPCAGGGGREDLADGKCSSIQVVGVVAGGSTHALHVEVSGSADGDARIAEGGDGAACLVDHICPDGSLTVHLDVGSVVEVQAAGTDIHAPLCRVVVPDTQPAETGGPEVDRGSAECEMPEVVRTGETK